MSIIVKGKTYIGPLPEDPSIYYAGTFQYYNPTISSYLCGLTSGGTVNNSFNVGGSLLLFFNTAGYVLKVKLQSDNKILIGGRITNYSSTTSNYLVRLNTDGSLDNSLVIGSGFNSDTNDIDIQADGKILVVGGFLSYSGVSKNRIIRLNSDGSIDNTFAIGTGFNNTPNVIKIQTDGKILVGGDFIQYSGISKNRVIRLNADGSNDNTFNIGTGFNNRVYSFSTQSDGKILVGGSFTSYSGVSKTAIIRLNNDGSIDNTFNPTISLAPNFSEVRSIIIQPDNKILIGGNRLNGATNAIVRLNVDGSTDNSFNIGSGFNGPIYDMKQQSDGKIIAGGVFTSVSGYNYKNIVKLNNDGTVDTTYTVGSGFSDQVSSIEILSNNDSFIGGYFEFYNQTQNVFNILKTNQYSNIDNDFNVGTGFNLGTNVIVRQLDKKLLIGGYFTTFNGGSFGRIIRLNYNNSVDTSFSIGTGFNGDVYDIKLQSDGKILVCGGFTSYNGTVSNRIIRLNTDGSIDNTFSIGTGFNQNASLMKIQSDGKVLVFGSTFSSFTTYSGVSKNRIVRLNTDGSIDNTFSVGTGFNASVNGADLLSDGKILVAGQFTTYSGVSRNRLVRLNTDGSVDNTFVIGLGIQGTGYSIKQIQNKILVSGAMSLYNGIPRNNLIRLENDGTLDTTFPNIVTGDVVSFPYNFYIDSYNRILMIGSFKYINGVFKNRICRLNYDGTIDETFNVPTGFFPLASFNPTYSQILFVKV
jgi:uncharacterized delta-60 repeat protein